MTRTPGAKAVDDAAAVALDGVESESIKVKPSTRRAGNAALGVWLPKFPRPKANQPVVATSRNTHTRRKKTAQHILAFIHGILRSPQVAHTRFPAIMALLRC